MESGKKTVCILGQILLNYIVEISRQAENLVGNILLKEMD